MANNLPPNGYLLGLDVGEKRIGVALASVIARLPQPAEALEANEHVHEKIAELVKKEDVSLVVIGLPRNMSGEETAQSRSIRDFASQLETTISVPVVLADESLSSVRADEIIKDNSFRNVSQDSLAACFILEEYIQGSV